MTMTTERSNSETRSPRQVFENALENQAGKGADSARLIVRRHNLGRRALYLGGGFLAFVGGLSLAADFREDGFLGMATGVYKDGEMVVSGPDGKTTVVTVEVPTTPAETLPVAGFDGVCDAKIDVEIQRGDGVNQLISHANGNRVYTEAEFDQIRGSMDPAVLAEAQDKVSHWSPDYQGSPLGTAYDIPANC